jgi:hypothetical protein
MPPQKTLTVERKNGEIYSHIRKKWLVETPEERVRQEYLCFLINEYGFSLEQIDEELSVTGRGSGIALQLTAKTAIIKVTEGGSHAGRL